MRAPRHASESRRRVLRYALGGAAALAVAGVAGFEGVAHGALPGKSQLEQLTGACDVPAPDLKPYAAPGPDHSGTFYSAARRRAVGYTIGYPPGHGPGDRLALVIALHGFGGNHADALAGITPSRALAVTVGGTPLPPMALVTVDGGNGYWNPHPGDNPQAMLVDELIPLCQRLGLGTGTHATGTHATGTHATGTHATGTHTTGTHTTGTHATGTHTTGGGGGSPAGIGVLGISMGGYGAIALAERYPRLIGAVAAISPAIWTSYAQARAVNAGAYASAADFAADDAVTHAAALAGTPVRLAVGRDDPFYPGVRALQRALPDRPGGVPAEVYVGSGCHTDSFFTAQEPPSLAFLARCLTAAAPASR